MLEQVCRDLSGIPYETNIPLSSLTSFRIGGPASLVVRPRCASELLGALDAVNAHGAPYVVLGNGTNVLAPDAGYDGVVIRLDASNEPPRFDGTELTCPAGVSLAAVSKQSVARGLMGMEALSGIPGTLGGAVAMNAGAYGTEMRDVVTEVTILEHGVVSTVSVGSGDFGVRKSAFSAPERIVLSAKLKLAPDDGGAGERMETFTLRRRTKQPLSYPSAGSVFKRPTGHFAGALIEQCGLKGCSVGGAQVSTLHAGFIVNTGSASEHDVRALIEHVQSVVLRETGVSLEREVRFLSEL